MSDSSCEGVSEYKSGDQCVQITSTPSAYVIKVNVVDNGTQYQGDFQLIKPRKSLALLYPSSKSLDRYSLMRLRILWKKRREELLIRIKALEWK